MKAMKTSIFIIAVSALLISPLTYGQKMDVNVKNSTVEWVGRKIGSSHDGNIHIKSGSLQLENGNITAVNIVMDMTTITNNDLKNPGSNAKLVGHLKSDDFFGVDNYPTASFKLTRSSGFSNGKARLTGDLTIKGKTESISFEVVRDGDAYLATIDIDRSKFDVRYGSDSFFDNLGDRAIDDLFTLYVKLVLS